MWRCRLQPAPTELVRACSCGGGGALDHAGHQRRSTIQGESQARTARSARGQDGAGGGTAAWEPPLSAAGSGPRRRVLLPGVISGPGSPAEAERAVDRRLVAADRDIGADLEVGPAQLVLNLLVALLDPVADAVDPGDLGQVRGGVRAAGLARAAGAGRRQRLVPVPRRQQPRQVLAEPPPLRHMSEQVIETGPRTSPADPARADTPPAWSSLITRFELTRKPTPRLPPSILDSTDYR